MPRPQLPLALALAAAALTQQAPLRRIARAEVEFRDPFTAVSSLRELSDGRVLVADSRERTLTLVDFRVQTAQQIGREGNGPGEFTIPQSLIALPADSTLLYDPANARLLLILPNGAPGPLFRLPPPFEPATAGGPRAADLHGRLYYERSHPVPPGGLYEASAIDILRYDRASGRVDSLATLALPEGRTTGARSLPGGQLRFFTNKPLAPQDVVAYAPDGRVAVIRARDYRVEWIAPSGVTGSGRLLGPPTPFERIPVSAAERKAFLEGQTRPGSIIVRGNPAAGAASGGAAPRAAPAPPSGDPFAGVPVDWPDAKPPFLAASAQIAPDGRVWVLKTRAHDDPVPVYDVFDGAGRLVERVALPGSTRLSGFGKGVLYLSRTDADDLVWLGRYRW